MNITDTDVSTILLDHARIMQKQENDIQSLAKAVGELTLLVDALRQDAIRDINPVYGPIE